MKTRPFYLALTALMASGALARAEITVITDHNNNQDAKPAFQFSRVPQPAKNGALQGKFELIDGDIDSNGGGLEKLNDGRTPTEEDQPDENFFFNAGSDGGRLRLDLNRVTSIRQINTYSWHANTRGPQVYKVYGAAGANDAFNPRPKRGTDPAACGWTLIAAVDTRPKDGEPGGQYGVSIRDDSGPLGSYRYLLFDCVPTEKDDEFGNTFYSEISVLGGAAADRAEITVITDHNNNQDAKPAFQFSRVPQPAKNGALQGKFELIDGDIDSNGGGVEKLNDGRTPTEEDQPDENLFFNAGSDGGRLRLDLNRVTSIRQINTYSWHPNTRGPQVYKVYGAAGANDAFNPRPKRGTDPAACGWTLIAAVDTRPKDGEPGGQYGVSIRDGAGPLGSYRYLLFDCVPTEKDDEFGNTFYSEISVLGAAAADSAPSTNASLPEVKPYVAHTADGKYEITVDTSRAPDLAEWATNTLAPTLAEWYPKIIAFLPSEGYEAPLRFTVALRPGRGVAATSGTRVTANASWVQRDKGEAVGALIHEAVHVVQQYGRAEHRNPDATQNPGYLVEGIADYFRWFKFEPQSKGAEITQRNLGRANYDRSYRVTANFLNWVSEKYDKDIVPQLNAAMREGNYTTNLWTKGTGKTVEQLNAEWKEDVKKKLEASHS